MSANTIVPVKKQKTKNRTEQGRKCCKIKCAGNPCTCHQTPLRPGSSRRNKPKLDAVPEAQFEAAMSRWPRSDKVSLYCACLTERKRKGGTVYRPRRVVVLWRFIPPTLMPTVVLSGRASLYIMRIKPVSLWRKKPLSDLDSERVRCLCVAASVLCDLG